MVFAGVYPFNQSETKELKAAIERLTLSDRSVSVTMESSLALGQGWRLGFLGILHMEARTILYLEFLTEYSGVHSETRAGIQCPGYRHRPLRPLQHPSQGLLMFRGKRLMRKHDVFPFRIPK